MIDSTDQTITRRTDDLFREEVLAARKMAPETKLLAGAQLFDLACRVTMDGIRFQHPHANEREVLEILRDRLRLARRLEETS